MRLSFMLTRAAILVTQHSGDDDHDGISSTARLLPLKTSLPQHKVEFLVRCAFSDIILHSMMPLDPTHVRLWLLHACDQWHSSREYTALIVVIINHVETLKGDSITAGFDNQCDIAGSPKGFPWSESFAKSWANLICNAVGACMRVCFGSIYPLQHHSVSCQHLERILLAVSVNTLHASQHCAR
jgi:hypothetical protein